MIGQIWEISWQSSAQLEAQLRHCPLDGTLEYSIVLQGSTALGNKVGQLQKLHKG